MGFDPISIGLMVAGLAVSAAGTVMGAQAQSKELAGRQALSNLQAQNERLDQVRQGRIRAAQIVQGGANQGAGESTALTGGVQSVQGQVESNVQQIGQQQGIVNSIFDAQKSYNNSQTVQQIGGAVSGLGKTLFDPDVQAGIKRTYTNVFGDA